MRYFNGQKVELLAPAGNFEIFEEVITANCDSVYFGGTKLNMRMIRKGYNFTNEEIVKAVKIAHNLGKKVYITLNNMLTSDDVSEAKEYLYFLNNVKVDAILVQDMAVVDLVYRNNIDIEMHSSVMMNVHNLETIKILKKYGITRIVASREMSLEKIKYISSKTTMEFEYFAHGDMCICHGAQCLYSGIVFGMSSNRGRCLKPCRWNYKLKKDGFVYPTSYPLAVKDMCMYEHIPEMIDAGITSFKIEGRMRQKDFIVDLVNKYGNAIDIYINNPSSYYRKLESEDIFLNRKRDLSTHYAFINPGLDIINTRYEGTGKFYSTGKMFSKPVEEKEITQEKTIEICTKLSSFKMSNKNLHKLSVRVNNISQTILALDLDVDIIYLAGDVFEPDKPFLLKQIKQLCNIKKSSQIFLSLPRMMNENHFKYYNELLPLCHKFIDGLLVTNMGAAIKYKKYGLKMKGDFSLNIFNHYAANFYSKEFGLDEITVSIEAHLDYFIDIITNSQCKKEVIVHGNLPIMYLEHNLYSNTNKFNPKELEKEHNKHINDNILFLLTDKAEYPVFIDQYKRNHIYSSKELFYLPILKELSNAGVNTFRIEGQRYTLYQLEKIIKAYKSAINNNLDDFYKLHSYSDGFTFGALNFNNQGGKNVQKPFANN